VRRVGVTFFEKMQEAPKKTRVTLDDVEHPETPTKTFENNPEHLKKDKKKKSF
jgi:hypothetical protein